MLQVKSENRPTCGNFNYLSYIDQLLSLPIIIKRLDYLKHDNDEPVNNLLQTIRVPKNMLFLSDHLPRSNYDKMSTGKTLLKSTESSLPKINTHSVDNINSNREKAVRREPREANSNDVNIEIKKKKKKAKENVISTNEVANLKLIADLDKNINNNNNNYNNGSGSPIKHKNPNALPDIVVRNEIVRIVRSPTKDQREKNSNDHMNQIYQIYVPYLKNQMGNKYNNKYNVQNEKSIKNIEKYYDVHNLKKIEANKKALIRKLSPLKNLR